eukprot:3522965-Pleurochrysis_carterae.AAC.1
MGNGAQKAPATLPYPNATRLRTAIVQLSASPDPDIGNEYKVHSSSHAAPNSRAKEHFDEYMGPAGHLNDRSSICGRPITGARRIGPSAAAQSASGVLRPIRSQSPVG